MTIEELSIGDWVYSLKSLLPVQIEAVYRNAISDCVRVTDPHHHDGVIQFVESVSPIPITVEILEKSGCEFLDDGNECRIFMCCDSFYARLDLGSDAWCIGIHNGDWHDKVIATVYHVHQLQHALTLAGIDKAIQIR